MIHDARVLGESSTVLRTSPDRESQANCYLNVIHPEGRDAIEITNGNRLVLFGARRPYRSGIVGARCR